MERITVRGLAEQKRRGERIAALTCYDATFARCLEAAGCEVLLVGDSLGMVLHGAETPVGVTVADMVYHTRMVAGAARRALVLADMPFQSYARPEQALATAARLMGEGGAQAVKLEGGAWLLDTIGQLSTRGIPVCGHLGLMPQSVHRLGGFRVQGREAAAAAGLLREAEALEDAGAMLLVLECVPRALAGEVATRLTIPVIGIGAGAGCDGQVLVLHDLLGLGSFAPRFTRNFLAGPDGTGGGAGGAGGGAGGAGGIHEAVVAYVRAVKAGEFPGPEHGFD
jgi:3-methyl-2-oxobutanoate hydroxymethyltransferase